MTLTRLQDAQISNDNTTIGQFWKLMTLISLWPASIYLGHFDQNEGEGTNSRHPSGDGGATRNLRQLRNSTIPGADPTQ